MLPHPEPPPKPPALHRPGLLRLSAVELLGALGLLFFTAPFVEDLKHGHLIEAILMTLVLVSSVMAVGGRRRTLIMAGLLVMPALLGRWANHLRPDVVPVEVFLLGQLVFLVFVAANLLRFVLRAPHVSSEVLCAGIAGYMLLGLLWNVAYQLVALATPAAFNFSPGTAIHTMDGFTATYFSFATLTTIGYGDIIPASKTARMLAVMEAMTGVFYIAVVISRLVALYSSRPAPPKGPSPAGHRQDRSERASDLPSDG